LLLNAPEKEMEQAVMRLLENGKVSERELEKNQDILLHYEAKELLGKKENHIVSELFQQRSIQELQRLARLITGEDENVIVLFVSQNENRLQLVVARGTARTEKMKAVIGDALQLINGKGGGNDSFAQGGGEALTSGEHMLEKLLELTK
jgi:alanyl-tRNA synthetase